MRIEPRLGRLRCLALVAALGLLAAPLAAAASGVAKVTRLRGKVEVKYGKKGGFEKVGKGTALKPGAVVRTGRRSRVEIRLADNSVIRLGSKSAMTLKQSMFDGSDKKVQARLWGGKAYALVNALTGDDSSFEIKTSTAVAGVRGTAFRINANEDKSTVVRVYTGAVAVSNAPIYAKAGKPKREGAFKMPRQGVKPGGPGRVEVAGPSEVTKKEWEEIVAKAMQEVRVSAAGELSAPVAFDPKKDLEDEWVAWNKKLDAKMKNKPHP